MKKYHFALGTIMIMALVLISVFADAHPRRQSARRGSYCGNAIVRQGGCRQAPVCRPMFRNRFQAARWARRHAARGRR